MNNNPYAPPNTKNIDASSPSQKNKCLENAEFHKIEIYITNTDILKALLYVHLRNKFLWGIAISASLFIHSISFIGLWALEFPIEETVKTIFDVFTSVLIFTFVGYFFTAIGFTFSKKWRRGRVGKHSILINNYGTTEETKYNKTTLKWSAINNITVSSNSLYIVHSGSEVFLIPKRCFYSESDWSTFIQYIKKHLTR